MIENRILNAMCTEWALNHKNGEKDNLSNGERSLLRQYKSSVEKGYDEIEISNICWENELADMIACIKKSEVKSFIITDSSTALLETLTTLIEAGFKVIETVNLEEENMFKVRCHRKGLRIEVKWNENMLEDVKQGGGRNGGEE